MRRWEQKPGFTSVNNKRKPGHRYLEMCVKSLYMRGFPISENNIIIRGSLESMTISALKVSLYYSNKS